jgi:peroxiredoxin
MKKKTSNLRLLILSGIVLVVCLMLFYIGFKKVSRFETSVRQVALTTGIYKPVTHQQTAADLKADYSLELIGLDKQSLNLSELKGKVIFMKYWATWCPTCVAEMPNVNSLYEKISNKDIVFLMISKDENKEKVRRFLDKKGYDFPVYSIKGALPEVYYSPSIPITFVIDPEGKIVYKKKGMANYDNEEFRSFLTDLVKK